jgi:hypothetical protein
MSGSIARLTVVVFSLACVPGIASPPDAAIKDFTQHVRGYVELRQRVSKSVPPLQVSAEWRANESAREALAHAIQAARANAAIGDIFTADAAPVFRQRISNILRERGAFAADVLPDLEDEAPVASDAHLTVNGRFDWAMGALMPGFIIAALPPLPDVLQYRFVDHDLVLLDIDAGLIVDILPNALAPS